MSKRQQKWAWVVMANDFPERVFDNESHADDFCMEANARDRVEARDATQPRARVYYRWYKLEVQS